MTTNVAPAEDDMGIGLRRTQRDHHASLWVYDLAAFEDALGRPLLVAFLRFAMATDRLASLYYALGLVLRPLPDLPNLPGTANDPNSIAANRTMMFLHHHMMLVLHELASAVEALKAAGLGECLAGDREGIREWKLVRRLARLWRDDPFVEVQRHGLAAHLGEESHIGAWLDVWRASAQDTDRFTLWESSGGSLMQTSYPAVVLLHAHSVGPKTLREQAGRVMDNTVRALQRATFLLMNAMIRAKGGATLSATQLAEGERNGT